MRERYTHRNGETEPPTIDEAWYWFDGGPDKPDQPFGVLHIFDGATYADGKMWAISELRGHWWGPVTPPWDINSEPQSIVLEIEDAGEGRIENFLSDEDIQLLLSLGEVTPP